MLPARYVAVADTGALEIGTRTSSMPARMWHLRQGIPHDLCVQAAVFVNPLLLRHGGRRVRLHGDQVHERVLVELDCDRLLVHLHGLDVDVAKDACLCVVVRPHDHGLKGAFRERVVCQVERVDQRVRNRQDELEGRHDRVVAIAGLRASHARLSLRCQGGGVWRARTGDCSINGTPEWLVDHFRSSAHAAATKRSWACGGCSATCICAFRTDSSDPSQVRPKMDSSDPKKSVVGSEWSVGL